jgi:RNA polymerase sigma-70 factor (ECF subfamily)
MGEKQPQFEQLLLPHLDAAYNLARWIVKRDQDAQDIVQEAYLQATKGIEGFRGTDARAWLLTIVRNTAYSWMKEHPNDSNMILTDAPIPDAPTHEPPHGSPQEARTRLLHEALNRLPAEYREILVLHEIEGWSYNQLASALNLAPEAVMSRLSLVRWRLQQEISRGLT